MEQLNELVFNMNKLDIASVDDDAHYSQPTVTRSQPQSTPHTLQADARPHRYWTRSPSCVVPVTAGRQDPSPKSPSTRRGGVHAQQDIEVPLAQLAVWPSGPPAEPSFLLDRGKFKRRPFTEKERQYAVEVILWELVCNPELTMQEMCRILVKKVRMVIPEERGNAERVNRRYRCRTVPTPPGSPGVAGRFGRLLLSNCFSSQNTLTRTVLNTRM